MMSRGKGERGKGRAWGVLLTVASGLLPLIAYAAPSGAPIGEGAEARIAYAIEHGETHPAPAVAALLGALGVEAADDAERRLIAAAIREQVCSAEGVASLCDDETLKARLAEWAPGRRRAAVRKTAAGTQNPAVKPGTPGTQKPPVRTTPPGKGKPASIRFPGK